MVICTNSVSRLWPNVTEWGGVANQPLPYILKGFTMPLPLTRYAVRSSEIQPKEAVMLDLDEVIERKRELEDIINDEDEQYSADEQKDAEDELAEINELESELGTDLESAARDGVYFIAECDFTDYAQEFAYDIGRIEANTYEWPYNHIDWDAAADDLKDDFSEVEWQGETYLFRY